MAESPVNAQVSGLQRANNDFSASPPGSMWVADNCVISQKGVLQPRRGQQNCIASSADIIAAMVEFQNNLVISRQHADLTWNLGHSQIAGNGSFTAYSGTFAPVISQAVSAHLMMKFAVTGDYLSFCCDDGARVLETYNGAPRKAGLERMPDALGSMQSIATLHPGVIPYNSSVAYRTMLRRPTSNGTSLLSPPSSRTVVTNRILIPPNGLTRSGTTATAVPAVGWNLGIAGLQAGDTFTLDPGEAAPFVAGTYTVTGTPTAAHFTFNVSNIGITSNTVAQDADTGPRSAQIQANLPSDAATTDAVRVYRSVGTSLSTVEPSDDLFLCNENFPNNTDISNGYVLVNDTTPQSQINDPIYTSPNLSAGILSSNFHPPLYQDIAVWNSQTWYLGTTGQQSLNIQMLGVGALNGIQNNDTLTIGGVVFTFKTSPGAPGDVQITSDGLPSYNIRQTTAALIEQIQEVMKDAANTIRAYSADSQGGGSGNILLQRIDYGAAFTVTASRKLTWTPALPATSSNDNQPNNLATSKLGEPEAVPLTSYTPIGSHSWPGLRLLALKNSLIVCKGGDGIYALTGQPNNYQTRQISTANVIAPNCCAVFADQAWCYTDQGVLKITDSGGCAVVSRQIETDLNALYVARPLATFINAFAVPYETERLILFYVPVSDIGSTGKVQLEAYCYSNATQSWTRFNRDASCGVVALLADRSHALVLGGWSEEFQTNSVTFERKTLTYLDIADEAFTVAVSSATSTTVTLSGTSHVAVGDGFHQGFEDTGDFYSKITAVNGNTLTLLEAGPWIAGAADVWKHYDVEAQFLPVGNPAGRKSSSSLVLLFKREGYESLTGQATCLTDQVQDEMEVDIPFLGFGLSPFGTLAFGNPSPLARNVSPFSPSDAAQYFVGFKMSEAWPKMLLEGFSLALTPAEGPAGRGK